MKTRTNCLKAFTIAALLGLQSLSAGYVGVGGGYMIDGEEEIFFAHIGGQLAKTSNLSHNIELEIGYTDADEMGVSLDVIPLMVNYRAVNTSPEKFDAYFGAGLGMSKVDVSYASFSDDDTVFTAQAMAGVDISLSTTTSLRLGYRYIYLESVELFGIELDDLDDSIIEVGLIVKF